MDISPSGPCVGCLHLPVHVGMPRVIRSCSADKCVPSIFEACCLYCLDAKLYIGFRQVAYDVLFCFHASFSVQGGGIAIKGWMVERKGGYGKGEDDEKDGEGEGRKNVRGR